MLSGWPQCPGSGGAVTQQMQHHIQTYSQFEHLSCLPQSPLIGKPQQGLSIYGSQEHSVTDSVIHALDDVRIVDELNKMQYEVRWLVQVHSHSSLHLLEGRAQQFTVHFS